MAKVDYKKELKQFYSAKTGTPVLVDVPKMNFLMIDGKGDPNTSQEYKDAITTLYPVAYTIKFMCKAENNDFGVMPLEGLWWSDDMDDFTKGNKDNWFWTAMIMQPPVVTKKHFEEAVKQVKEKKTPASIDKIRFEAYKEGRAAQIMHIGSYSEEDANIELVHQLIFDQGGKLQGLTKKHHEIYLSDPRRVDPSKLKTIIRQPF